ncbi:MAG: cysteinyl-tRNA synthetase [Kosmotoga sp.]|uniref:Cysteine--tRNA ligase n=1 Tax=Kosmotoga olearia (strain ATCC BAA-1733 / DSM 21960 / TBF 19.5.1) TaxID=521045 RepID=C5CFQ1_KOSOT|nr:MULTISPECIES: cysteine--tRNA ligase [Kosmotoga]ACR80399.1 cysteinyl-tRNA synthetase [Kosmotoga olearia TBF 19.5.1]MDI3523371.1 cysteinyl-tRNA synthetase [Kosmotoga sp.]MDK2952869.1 cysteinyl-tRNA synthetase [Kosmotoga sp.]
MLRITNTLTGKKEEFIPITPGEVRIYVCGPTVYNFVHLGNSRPAITFDAFRRYLEYRGYRVILAQNFTDIDDKIIIKANEEGVDALEIAERYIVQYWKDSLALGIRPANFHPRTTHFVDEIIEFIQDLIDKGFAYVVDGDVYFNVSEFKNYGELSHRKLEDMIAGARIEPGEKKKSPEDFALWKAAKEGEPFWNSPWGPGRPGWHIECSVMSTCILGETFDIHAGGADLIFPHHENEKAQSEARHGKTFARYWMHNGMMRLAGSKMSKSLGNFITIKDAVKKYGKDAIRLFIFSKHYRSPIDYSEEMLAENLRAVKRVNAILRDFEKSEGDKPLFSKKTPFVKEQIERFIEALDDDFNTPKAVALMFDLINKMGETKNRNRKLEIYHLIRNEFGPVLGILEKDEEVSANIDGLVKLLIEIRAEFKKDKNYEKADQIRDRLNELGIKLMDTPEGTKYTF